MSAFNVGDKVRLTGTKWDRDYHGFQAGDIVTISRVASDGSGIFDTPKGDYWYVFPTSTMRSHGDWGGIVVTEPPVPTVRRSDIVLTEEKIDILDPDPPNYWPKDELRPTIRKRIWLASLYGNVSTGEMVTTQGRAGETAAEALGNLEDAIREQGWEIE